MIKSSARTRIIAAGAGFAGDRIDPAVTLAASGRVNAIALECLAERTLVPGLRARRVDPKAGHDPRLERRLRPLLPVAKANDCRLISNLGAANPASAVTKIAALGAKLGLSGLEVAGIIGDDVLKLRDEVAWDTPVRGELIGAHAYLGAEPIAAALSRGADVVVTGRCADSALFSADAMSILDGSEDALAGATTIGHLLECTGQVTGGNFETVDGGSLSAAEFARLGFPIAEVRPDGTADIFLLDGQPGRIDQLTCTLQLLYEVHDPSRYITPDGILDFTGVRFEQVGPNRVRVTGARSRGRPQKLKVSGFVEESGFIADVEIGYAGTGALNRGRVAADTLRLRLADLPREDVRIDLVGVDSIIGAASQPPPNALPEVRVHVSARCADAEVALMIEDEVYSLTLSGPAGGGSVRSERRPSLAVIDGFIDRTLVTTDIVWETVP
jgi:Acyclic terpene utilisation family protein AtuA